jgi:acyl-CoA reductase-like NAD-dependent aldehyde dehydrogenase
MNAYEIADELDGRLDHKAANMLRKQADRIAELEDRLSMYEIKDLDKPQIKELSNEELNKAFDYYCETDEGVLRFNYELRDEWKKEQLIRWKEAFKKASEK